jgi:3-oxoacyl-[acyl-carrier protein] reductase
VSPRLDGRYALVTGGTRGVGRAISHSLAAAGADVLAGYRTDEAAAGRLASARCRPVRADLRTAAGRAAVVAAARSRFGGLDVLVNNFGTYQPAALSTMDPKRLEESLHSNLTAHLLLTRAVLPLLRDGATIVNIGAGMAERGRPGHSHFTAAKAGLVGFTRSLARELADRGIRVNTVAPGVVATERGIDLPEAVRAGILAAIPLGRFATPDDVAKVVVFLSSAVSRGITGATIRVDGGI